MVLVNMTTLLISSPSNQYVYFVKYQDASYVSQGNKTSAQSVQTAWPICMKESTCKEGYVMNSKGECIRRPCLYPSVVENCVCKCPPSFVQIEQTCRNCGDYGCVKCRSFDQIHVDLSLVGGQKVWKMVLVQRVVSGKRNTGEVCVQCFVYIRAFCAFGNVCAQCLPGQVSKQNGECPSSQYEAHGMCRSCHANCAQCRKYASSYIACAQGKYLFASDCISWKLGCSYHNTRHLLITFSYEIKSQPNKPGNNQI